MAHCLRVLVAVLAMLGAGVVSAALPTCTTGQLPYELYLPSSGAIYATGSTPGEACAKYVQSSTAREVLVATDGLCAAIDRTVTPNTNFVRSIRQVCAVEDPTSLTPNKVQTYMELWAAFLVAGVAVLAGKAVYNRFRIDYDRG